MSIKVKIKRIGDSLPQYETAGSAGMDIRAHISESILLKPGERYLIPTGIYIELPQGFEVQIRARSGLAIKHGIGLVNGVGTIDSDYRGEIKIPLINWGKEDFEIKDGERIAQIILAKYETIVWDEVEILESTERGEGGFGHTGKS